jgi:two-component system, OmpR family, response regulator CpxR
MSIIGAFTGTYCREEPAIREIVQRTGFTYLTDADIVAKASSLSGISENKIQRAFRPRTPVFNRLTHEKELSLAYLKLALAETLKDDKIFINGFTSLLIPSSIADVLRICIISDMKARGSAALALGLSERKAFKILHKDDKDRITWVRAIAGKDDPWDCSLYDMVLPTNTMTPEEIGDLIAGAIGRVPFMRTLYAQKVIEDFVLACRVDVALIKKGYYDVATEADTGAVTVTINKNVIMLKRLENNLQYEAKQISGVTSVTTKVGPQFHQSDIVRKFDLIVPSRPFRVDHERQFVSALSERAGLRSNRVYSRL